MVEQPRAIVVDRPPARKLAPPRLWLSPQRAKIAAGATAAVGACAIAAEVGSLRLPLGLILIAALAYANGSNDVSKAIATLVGSGVTSYRRALTWGALTTGVGAVLSFWIGAAIVATFSKSILAASPSYTLAFAVAIGALAWVGIATRIALPVSTTHSIVGAIVGTGIAAHGLSNIHWSAVVEKVVKPLLISPFVGFGAAAVLIIALRIVRIRPYSGLHWLSAGATAAARGVNDAPKLAAIGAMVILTTRGHTPTHSQMLSLTLLVAGTMLAGSIVGGWRVTRTLGEKVTSMDNREGFAANVVTATVVTLATFRGFPVSTTHVSTGSICGIGAQARDGRLNLRLVSGMVLAWVVTLPGSALLAVAGWGLVNAIK